MESRYHCTICDKKYKSYKSLWKHNKDFHVIKDSLSTPFSPPKDSLSIPFSPPKDSLSIPFSSQNDTHSIITERPKKTLRTICNYCNLKYASYKGVLKHEKICKEKNNDIIEISKNTISEQIINILNNKKVDKETINEINKILSNSNITPFSLKNGTLKYFN
jgi:hypothetical protein